MKKKIAAVATSGNKLLWRKNFYISNVVTCMDVTVGSAKYSHECEQCFPWALFSFQTWCTLTWEGQKRDKIGCIEMTALQKLCCVPTLQKRLCSGSGCPRSHCAGALRVGFNNSAGLCLHSSSPFLLIWLYPPRTLTQLWTPSQSGALALPFPFCFLHTVIPTSSALCCHLWCNQCPQCGWGLLRWGRDILQGTEDFLCLRVDVWSTGYFICFWI